jgi:type IV fimbrial biogenesis protein FimT
MYQRHIRGAQRRARQLGLTLVETLVAVGIAGTVTAIGVPNLNHFRDKAAVNSRFQAFDSALRRARHEAMARGELVSMCAMDPKSAGKPQPDCLPSGRDWSAGWLVFVDRGERGELDENDRVVWVEAAPADTGPIVGTQRYLTFRAGGELLSLAGHFRFLPPGEQAVDKALPGSALVCVNRAGRPRVAKVGQCAS